MNKIRLYLGKKKIILFLAALIFMTLGVVLSTYSDEFPIMKVITSTCIIVAFWSFLGLLFGINEREYALTKGPEPDSLAAIYPFINGIALSLQFVLNMTMFILFLFTPFTVIFFMLLK